MVKAVEDRGERRVVVYYRDGAGVERRKLFPLTAAGRAEARVFVLGWHEEKQRQMAAAASPATPVTPVLTHELWAQYAESELSHLRGKTIISYRYHWRRWEAFIGRDTPAAEVTVKDCSRFRAAALTAGASLNQARQTLQIVRGIYRWGVSARLFVDKGVLAFRWKRGKDDPKPIEPDEYSRAEYELLLQHLNRDDARQWRAWVFLMLAGHHGQRANAVLHLRWQDVDLANERVFWDARWQKQGVTIEHPLLWETLSALETARQARERAAHYRVRPHHKSRTAGPERLAAADWVLFAERDKACPMSYSSLHYHLRQAEIRAGVPHRDYRAAHGFRRMVVGEIGERTGDRLLGLEFVGDTDPKMLKSYDRRRQARIERGAEAIQSARTPEHATKAGPESIRESSGNYENTNADDGASASGEANSLSHGDF